MLQDRQVYSELDKRAWSYSPNLVRWRQRYKGVRDSLKINQEASQILYDLYQLNLRISALLDAEEEHAEALYGGKSDFEDVNYVYDATPSTYESVGFKDLSERLTRIDRILKARGN